MLLTKPIKIVYNVPMIKPIMIQGTASNVGKSIVTTALCRIFFQDGHKTAPFKAQNMSLNSYPTKDGGEIGRAQIVQAEACHVAPTVDMNPILLKPIGEKKCQVILHGRVHSNMTTVEYFNFKDKAWEAVVESFEKLHQKYELIVIEGAGSPAEINLKDNDIVNMKVAKLAQSPVILVTDIDKGGSFAAIVGTLELLDEDERDLVKGIIFNKFRGDEEILKPGLQSLEKRVNIPVVGIIPYIPDLRIDQEDSVWFDGSSSNEKLSISEVLRINVIKLPRISNFTDFNALSKEPLVLLDYVENTLNEPDLIIIPGTKNTIEDMFFLQETGLYQQIKTKAKEGVMVIGICGGYQMLGKKIYDPQQVESNLGQADGLGLLNIRTVLTTEKVTAQVKAECIAKDFPFKITGYLSGYEIHAGETVMGQQEQPAFLIFERSGKEVAIKDGCVNEDGQVFGTYLHGLFDNMIFRKELINYLWKKKGFRPVIEKTQVQDDKYDKLADIFLEKLDMEYIYKLIKVEG